MPPDCNSSRAKYQRVGAVSPKCGSLAINVAPAVERLILAVHAFDAPANAGGFDGLSGPKAMRLFGV